MDLSESFSADDGKEPPSQQASLIFSDEADEGSSSDEDQHQRRKSSQESAGIADATWIIRWQRLIVVASTVSAIFASLYIFLHARKSQQSDFSKAAADCGSVIVEAIQSNVERAFANVDSFAVSVTAEAESDNVTWPFGTLSHFCRRVDNAGPRNAFMVAPVVLNGLQTKWGMYSVNHNKWIEECEELAGGNNNSGGRVAESNIYRINGDGSITPDNENATALPVWQTSPVALLPFVNFNLLSSSDHLDPINAVLQSRMSVLSQISAPGDKQLSVSSGPSSFINYPVFDGFDDKNRTLVAVILSELAWAETLADLHSMVGMVVVVSNTCQQSITFKFNGRGVDYLGVGDLHNADYNDLKSGLEIRGDLAASTNHVLFNKVYCPCRVDAYPSDEMRDLFISNKPMIYVIIVVASFVVTLLVFLIYGYHVDKSLAKLQESAARSHQIVSSLFPSNVRQRLLYDEETANRGDHRNVTLNNRLLLSGDTPKLQLQSFLSSVPSPAEEDALEELFDAKPIADLFPNTTVLFADIAGFTAWSSAREPCQVFTLLEAVYRAFDKLAKKRGVFKVETIGDCYMAVTGLPEPQEDHAVIMARFAFDCILKMKEVTRKLEVTLGPDTGDLSIRIGLHSGPVTAGVLRGEKSRFQLFGDTVNTASRMESTGKRNLVQVSSDTAFLLGSAGKSHWIKERDDKVFAKGKGEMNTFWLTQKVESTSGSTISPSAMVTVSTASVVPSSPSLTERTESSPAHAVPPQQATPPLAGLKRTLANKLMRPGRRKAPRLAPIETPKMWGDSSLEVSKEKVNEGDKLERLIDWNTDNLLRILKAVVARRRLMSRHGISTKPPISIQDGLASEAETILEEVTEIITLPTFDPTIAEEGVDPDTVRINARVCSQLRNYVAYIASMYKENPFHNFEHASHVSMSANKLIQRIVAPDEVDYRKKSKNDKKLMALVALDLHEYTFGITSDPLAQFAVVFSALIHDVDHAGVSNFQIILEKAPIAVKYKGKSVAEQNSVDLAWAKLMEAEFEDLRKCVYTCEDEGKRFRQLVVNCVMATDIFDKELQNLRRQRWSKAFQVTARTLPLSMSEDTNRKATIVIEHIIQASDVAHTMQHWQIYQKWNERLFNEMYDAWKAGRAGKDPSVGWYQGELGFFDNYIIPLARKLKECGVFGVSSDEYLNYALENRREWATKGEEIVRLMRATKQKQEAAATFSKQRIAASALCA